jgi:Leucine Rich repeat
LVISTHGYNNLKPPVDRQSLQHLIDFLDNNNNNRADGEHEDDSPEGGAIVTITELKLHNIRLVEPSDGGLNVLKDFFSRSNTTPLLTKVTLEWCSFGSQDDASQLLAAFHTNRTVTDLRFHRNHNIEGGAALGNALSALLQNTSQLQRLNCERSNHWFHSEGVRALQPGLRVNRTLKELDLYLCNLRDTGVHLLADALVDGNTAIQVLDICGNDITANGLVPITRMIESMAQLETLSFFYNHMVNCSQDDMRHFAAVLGNNSTIKKLRVSWDFTISQELFGIFVCTRNQHLAHVDMLLAPLLLLPQRHRTATPPPPRPHPRNGMSTKATTATTTTAAVVVVATTMWRKTCHKAIAKFAQEAGASAIFKLFRTRPALLEKRLERPPSAAAVAAAAAAAAVTDATIAAAVSHPGGDYSNSSMMIIQAASSSPASSAAAATTDTTSQQPTAKRPRRL